MADFVLDTFTEVSNTPLEDHTGETGATWTLHPSFTSYLRVLAASDELAHAATGSGVSTAYYASGVPSGADYDVTMDVLFTGTTSDAGVPGVAGRMSTSANTYYFVRHNRPSDVWQLYKRVAGSATLLGSYSQTLSTGVAYELRLEITDATKKVFIDGVERISSADNAITADGRAGIWWFLSSSSQTEVRADNFVATEEAAAPTIAGDVTQAQTANAAITYQQNPLLIGDVTVVQTANAIMAYQQHLAITGDVTLTQTANAAMVFSSGFSITGSVTVTQAANAVMDYAQHSALIGDVVVSQTANAVMSFSSGAVIIGGVTQTQIANAVTAYQQSQSIIGDVTLTQTANAAMAYQPAVAPGIKQTLNFAVSIVQNEAQGVSITKKLCSEAPV